MSRIIQPNMQGVSNKVMPDWQRIDALIKHARILDQKVNALTSCYQSLQQFTLQMMGTMEALSRILVEKEVLTTEEIVKYREEYLDVQQKFINALNDNIKNSDSLPPDSSK